MHGSDVSGNAKGKEKMVGMSDRRGWQMAVDRGTKKTERGTEQRQMQSHNRCVPTPSAENCCRF